MSDQSRYVAVTTGANRLRHRSVDVVPYRHGGMFGSLLCDRSLRGYDQEARDADARAFGVEPPAKRIADLPACKRCLKAVASRE